MTSRRKLVCGSVLEYKSMRNWSPERVWNGFGKWFVVKMYRSLLKCPIEVIEIIDEYARNILYGHWYFGHYETISRVLAELIDSIVSSHSTGLYGASIFSK